METPQFLRMKGFNDFFHGGKLGSVCRDLWTGENQCEKNLKLCRLVKLNQLNCCGDFLNDMSDRRDLQVMNIS